MIILPRTLWAFFMASAVCLAGASDCKDATVYAQVGPNFGGLEESQTGPPVTGKVVEDGKVKEVIITSHSGQWTAFPSMGGGNLAAFLVSGKVQNASGKKLTYVKFQFELVGEDEIVLYRDYGYNRKAEMLRDEEYESGEKSLAEMGIEEIPSKGEDGFRFVFFKDDISEFQGYRIRVMEVK